MSRAQRMIESVVEGTDPQTLVEGIWYLSAVDKLKAAGFSDTEIDSLERCMVMDGDIKSISKGSLTLQYDNHNNLAAMQGKLLRRGLDAKNAGNSIFITAKG